MERLVQIGRRYHLVQSDDTYLTKVGDNFEPAMVSLFAALISPHDIVLDIGGNIGLTALLFSDLSAKVLAFEPSPTTFSLLQANLAQAGFENVTAFNRGLGPSASTTTLTFSQHNRSGGFVSDQIHLGAGYITESIQIETLDDLVLPMVDHVNFIKIDVEGFEADVLDGGMRLLERDRPTVVLEMNHFCLNVLRNITIRDFLSRLLEIFPYLYAVDNDNRTIADLTDEDRRYAVMHAHVTRHRFPTLIGAYDSRILTSLEYLTEEAEAQLADQVAPSVDLSAAFGSVSVIDAPSEVSTGSHFEIHVKLSNEGLEPWVGYGSNPIRLSYHWALTEGKQVVRDGARSSLRSRTVQPGASCEEYMRVAAPIVAGKYLLEVTLVQEGIAWLETRGLTSAREPVHVNR